MVPVALKNEDQLFELITSLRGCDVYARRYFYPSLDNVDFLNTDSTICPESQKLSKRIVCLPIYSGLKVDEVEMIAKKVLEVCE